MRLGRGRLHLLWKVSSDFVWRAISLLRQCSYCHLQLIPVLLQFATTLVTAFVTIGILGRVWR